MEIEGQRSRGYHRHCYSIISSCSRQERTSSVSSGALLFRTARAASLLISSLTFPFYLEFAAPAKVPAPKPEGLVLCTRLRRGKYDGFHSHQLLGNDGPADPAERHQ